MNNQTGAGEPQGRQRSASVVTRALLAWSALTAIAVLQTVVLAAFYRPTLDALLLRGPLSDYHVTVLSVCSAWLVVGSGLLVERVWRPRGPAQWAFIGAAIVALLYINVLRERPAYGDVHDYLAAASHIRSGEALPARYLYPPLWAMLLSPLVPFGWRAVFDAVWLANLGALVGVALLLPRLLRLYGYSPLLAVVVTTTCLVVNVPVLRTLGYMQVNLHVLNLIVVSLLCGRRSRATSATALAVAAQLKISPAALALAFLMDRDWKWLAWFSAATLAIAGLPMLIVGPKPYFDVWHNLQHVYEVNPLSFRDNSVDSFVRATAVLVKGGPDGFGIGSTIWTLKGVLAAVCLALAWRNRCHGTYVTAAEPGAAVLNAAPALLLLMVLASPLIWEHHGVFAIVPFLVAGRRVEGPAEWTLFLAAYFVVFLLPTFDYYPWSYARLVGLLSMLALMWRASSRTKSSAVCARIEEQCATLANA